MASSSSGYGGQEVPSWNGDPGSFSTFETACRWYVLTLKDSEKAGAAARIWSRLSGPAKSVVRHLDPDRFHHAQGLQRLLEILRRSPLQTLPIPDTFQKLERWSNMKRKDQESIPEFLVREEENFAELQQSLKRSRDLRKGSPTIPEAAFQTGAEEDETEDADTKPETGMEDFEDLPDFKKASPSSSPKRRSPASPSARQATLTKEAPELEESAPDYFNDELRGYRLLKGVGLSTNERQQVLTLAGNKVNFQEIRQALRAFGNETDLHRRHRHRDRAAWWAADEALMEEEAGDDDFQDEDSAYWAEAAYWNDAVYWQQWADWGEDASAYYEQPFDPTEQYPEHFDGDQKDDEAEPTAEEADLVKQEGEAMALAAEANRTLSQARAAVAQVRAARGYYPLGGKQPQKGKSKGPAKCLICGQPGHFFRECPRRFQDASAMYQKGASKGGFRPKGKGKGKGPAKGRGKASYFADPVYYQAGFGMYMMQVVRDEPAVYYENCAPDLDADLLSRTVKFGPTVRSHLASNSFGREMDSYENSVKDPLNENIPLSDFDDVPDQVGVNSNGTSETMDWDPLSMATGHDPMGTATGHGLADVINQTAGAAPAADRSFLTGVGRSFVNFPGPSSNGPSAMMLQTVGVMHSGPGLGLRDGRPNFVLDTGATENAAGVRTIQRLLGLGATLKKVDLSDRPTFRFGDGLSLKAKSKVELGNTSLGDVEFYVLDGDHRTTTRHSEDTPLLVGSRFLHEHQACISYEHLYLFLRKAGGEILCSPLERTRTGHLVLDPRASPVNITALKEQAEERFGVQLPADAVRLLQLFSSPGAVQALRPAEGDDDQPISGAVCGKQGPSRAAEQCYLDCRVMSECVYQGCSREHVLPHEQVCEGCCSAHVHPLEHEPLPHEPLHDPALLPHVECQPGVPHVAEILAVGAHDEVVPSLPHQIRALQLRLASLQIRSAGTLHGENPGARDRSSQPRMAVPRQALAGKGEGQPVRPLAGLQKVRPPNLLQDDQARARRAQDGGPNSGSGADGDGRARGDGGPGRGGHQRHGGEREDHGGTESVLSSGLPCPAEDDHGPRQDGDADVRQPQGHDFQGGSHQEALQCTTGGKNPDSANDAGGKLEGHRGEPGRAQGPAGGEGRRAPGGQRTDHVLGVPPPGDEEQASQPGGEVGRLGEHERDREQQPPRGRRGWQPIGAVKAYGVGQSGSSTRQSGGFGRPLGPDLEGLPEREGITLACRKRMLHESKGFMASALCIATSLLALTTNSIDLFEVGGGNLSPAFRDEGFLCETVTKDRGYHFGNAASIDMIHRRVLEKDPTMLWVQLPDQHLLRTEWSGPPGQWRNFERARRRDLQAAERMAETVVNRIENDKLFGWMWRADAQWGWRSRAIEKIREAARQHGTDLYECVVDQCCYERGPEPSPVRWKILTNAKQLRYKVGRRSCPGHRTHGDRTTESPQFPEGLVKDIVEAVTWDVRRLSGLLRDDVEAYMTEGLGAAIKDYNDTAIKGYNNAAIKGYNNAAIKGHNNVVIKGMAEQSRELMPLQRTSLPVDKPTGRKLEEVKSQLMRMHRAAGHTSFEALARLLQKRNAAEWACDLARELRCPDCEESRRITPAPPASTESPPTLWEYLGMDVFEYEFERDGSRMKAKFLLMQDRASRLCMVKHLHSYAATESWEPATSDIKAALINGWMSVNPAPTWLLTDAPPYFVSSELTDFCSRSGVGLLTAPAEAHWLMGHEERRIQTLKRTAAKLEREGLGISIEEVFSLAAHGANSSVNASGFSPFQWTRGWQKDEVESLPEGVRPNRAFARTLALKEKAKAAFVKSDAAERLSRLNNSVQRRAEQYAPGTLIMLWRQRLRQGRGSWVGPLRLLVQEGSTVWLASGATLIRAKTNQIRHRSSREELIHTTQGIATIRNPVSLSTLLRGYTGRHYIDASQETPGQAIEEDMAPAAVQAEPDPARKRQSRDKWELREGALVRIHGMPRLAIFPGRL